MVCSRQMKNMGSYSAEVPLLPRVNCFLIRISKKTPAHLKAVINLWFLLEGAVRVSSSQSTMVWTKGFCRAHLAISFKQGDC